MNNISSSSGKIIKEDKKKNNNFEYILDINNNLKNEKEAKNK